MGASSRISVTRGGSVACAGALNVSFDCAALYCLLSSPDRTA